MPISIEADVICALEHARECRSAAGSRWRVTGPDIDGDELNVVVAVEAGVVVITLF